MRLAELVKRLSQRPAFHAHLESEATGLRWTGLAPEARPAWTAAAYAANPRPTLILTTTHERALHWQARLTLCGIPSAKIKQLPSGLSVLFEDTAPETVALSDRIGALHALSEGTPIVVIATVSAALERTLPADLLVEAFLTVKAGQTLDPPAFTDTLKRLGYEPADPVRVPGQYARRGGLIDVFPMGASAPIRIDLFDTEVESLRTFDPITQRSTGTAPELTLAPSRETQLPPSTFDIRSLIEPTLAIEANQLEEEAADRLQRNIKDDLKALEDRVFFDRLDLYRPLIQPESGCAIDLLGPNGQIILDEPLELQILAQRIDDELSQALTHRHERGEILRAFARDFLLPVEHIVSPARTIALTHMNAVPDWYPEGPEHDWQIRSLASLQNTPQAVYSTLKNWVEAGTQVYVATDQPNRVQRVLNQFELFPTATWPDGEEAGVFLAEGNLAGGFISPDFKIALVTDQELFGVGRLKLPQRRFNEGVPIATVLDLKPGDYVVHITHGIGIYRGLVQREIEGQPKEFLFIEYRSPDKLFLPAEQLDRVQKYLAPGEAPPKLNKLSGGEWQRTVGKAREDAREFARELIRLYAKRKAVTRPSTGPDTSDQGEMEYTFPWVETPSQLNAILEVKADLETEFPMDRLVCGDVGFGKTEVAIRAAFKVVQAHRQVAVLCPTTILSEQHYRNFKERLEPFGVRVELINRFRSTAERTQVEKGLEDGTVQVVVGTHALLSQKLRFKELGLLIIDEEQKFGVKHKESLQKLRVNIDVLSMSATPIPRTLSIALMNIRPMSLINDPPPGRLPIRSSVRPYSDEVVREALLRELARGGQAYYVTHRVDGIDLIADRLRRLVPSARVAIGHGQMTERELEPVMLGFIRGEIDILVSTTIVENGLDIPNANTIIVDNVEHFGLSQLYQLRGRVGRSDRQAYAYCLFNGNKSLTENAMARLDALQEFAHLGSGYSLAFRDLQIRGAGDLLGAKQSGQMIAVGYELYAQLIESEVKFLKTLADGDDVPAQDDPLRGLEPLPALDLPSNVLIPANYIDDEGQRLYFYQRIMGARTLDILDEISAEMSDRYGPMPRPVQNAFAVMQARLRADALHIEKIDANQGRVLIEFRSSATHGARVLTLLTRARPNSYLTGDGKVVAPFSGDALEAVRTTLDALEQAIQQVEEARAALNA